jgi:hypothetical protein
MNKLQLSHLRTAYNNPSAIRNKILEVSDPIRRYIFIKRYGDMTDIMKKEWDNLIILDACRYDTFAKRNIIDGKVKRIISKGSHSSEFIKHNFSGRYLSDTIYITANPNAERIGDNVFYKIKKTYTEESINNQIDHSSVCPEKIIQTAIQTLDKFPNKRMIVHFMQPHSPFLGEYANNLRKKIYKQKIYRLLEPRIKKIFLKQQNLYRILELRKK